MPKSNKIQKQLYRIEVKKSKVACRRGFYLMGYALIHGKSWKIEMVIASLLANDSGGDDGTFRKLRSLKGVSMPVSALLLTSGG